MKGIELLNITLNTLQAFKYTKEIVDKKDVAEEAAM